MNASLLRQAAQLPPAQARRVVRALVAAEGEIDPLAETKAQCAAAWEGDMQPVCTALAAALHAESEEALRGLGHLLPGLQREVAKRTGFQTALARAMTRAFTAAFEEPLVSADGVTLAAETAPTDALTQLRRRTVFETDLSSAELRGFAGSLRDRSIFSARCTNAEFLEEVKGAVDDILSGKINQATGRLRLLGKLKELGYDPAVGFPGDMASVPPAERGSLQDLSSTRRLDLIIETNVRMAANYGKMVAGNQPYELREYPAWELVRLYDRDLKRGFKHSSAGATVPDPRNAWPTRWAEAGESVLWEGAHEKRMIARKDSPLWQALGDGAGGHTDTLLNPFPPFAFRSGMGWRAVTRAECIQLGLADDPSAPMPGTLAPSPNSAAKVYDGLSPDLQAELKRELETLGL